MRNLIAGLVAAFSFCIMCDTTSAQWPNNGQAQYPRYGRVIGYQPHVVWLPQGTSLTVNNPQVYYSRSGKRYVRFGVNASFYHIPQVNTFQYYGPVPNYNYNYNYNFWRR